MGHLAPAKKNAPRRDPRAAEAEGDVTARPSKQPASRRRVAWLVTETCSGWAVAVDEGWVRPLLLGRFYDDPQIVIPASLGAYETAVFRTRREARALAKRIRGTSPDATVVRVSIAVVSRAKRGEK